MYTRLRSKRAGSTQTVRRQYRQYADSTDSTQTVHRQYAGSTQAVRSQYTDSTQPVQAVRGQYAGSTDSTGTTRGFRASSRTLQAPVAQDQNDYSLTTSDIQTITRSLLQGRRRIRGCNARRGKLHAAFLRDSRCFTRTCGAACAAPNSLRARSEAGQCSTSIQGPRVTLKSCARGVWPGSNHARRAARHMRVIRESSEQR